MQFNNPMGANGAINQGNKPQDIPDWEEELWTALCSNEGAGCHIYNQCQTRQNKLNCVVDITEQILQIRGHLPHIEKDNSIISIVDCRLHQLVKLLAQQCLDSVGITSPPVPDEIVHLIDPEKKVEIRQLPFKRYHGAVWHIGDNKWIIYLNSNDTTGRRRVALFHEYFHILASCNAKTSFSDTQITYSKMNRICLLTEMMADAFAVNLLIPQIWLENNFPKIGDVKLIAETCNVAYTLTYLKLKSERFIS